MDYREPVTIAEAIGAAMRYTFKRFKPFTIDCTHAQYKHNLGVLAGWWGNSSPVREAGDPFRALLVYGDY